MSYEVGKSYMVPCVFAQLGRDDPRWWPVMGSPHEDKEIIGFPLRHWHIDWRFVAKNRLYSLTVYDSYAYPLQVGNGLNVCGFPEPQMRRRKYRWGHPDPMPFRRAKWMPKLEAAYAGCKLAHGRVCPHRGYDLSNEKPDAHGNVVCPMHGLRWNVATGSLVPSVLPMSNLHRTDVR